MIHPKYIDDIADADDIDQIEVRDAVDALLELVRELPRVDTTRKDGWCIRMTDDKGLRIERLCGAKRFLSFGELDEATYFLHAHDDKIEKLADIGLL